MKNTTTLYAIACLTLFAAATLTPSEESSKDKKHKLYYVKTQFPAGYEKPPLKHKEHKKKPPSSINPVLLNQIMETATAHHASSSEEKK